MSTLERHAGLLPTQSGSWRLNDEWDSAARRSPTSLLRCLLRKTPHAGIIFEGDPDNNVLTALANSARP